MKKTTDIKTITPAILDLTIVALFPSLEDADTEVVMMQLVLSLKGVLKDVTENVKGSFYEELLAVHINNPSILVLASGFEDGELVLAIKIPVALPLVGRFLCDNDVSRVSVGWDVYVVLLIYFVL